MHRFLDVVGMDVVGTVSVRPRSHVRSCRSAGTVIKYLVYPREHAASDPELVKLVQHELSADAVESFAEVNGEKSGASVFAEAFEDVSCERYQRINRRVALSIRGLAVRYPLVGFREEVQTYVHHLFDHS